VTGENLTIEAKLTVDLDDPASRMQLVKELVAFANTQGGSLHVGVADDGSRPGIDADLAGKLDPSRLCDVVNSYIHPDHLEIDVVPESSDDSERTVVRISVRRYPSPPIVIAKQGNYQGTDGNQPSAFRVGDVLVRKGTKVERAARPDYQNWIQESAEAARRLLMERVALITRMPEGASLQVVTEDEEIDEPSSLLARSLRAWRRDSSKLLSGRELALLLLTADTLSFDDDAERLVVGSALRRKATLWHWMAQFNPDPLWTEQALRDAVVGRDRDKSDAGRAIVDLGAAILDDTAYRGIIDELQGSTYAHFKDAASVGADQEALVRTLRDQRALPLDGGSLEAESDADLRLATTGLATSLLGDGRHQGEARKLGRLGLELFARSPGGVRLR